MGDGILTGFEVGLAGLMREREMNGVKRRRIMPLDDESRRWAIIGE